MYLELLFHAGITFLPICSKAACAFLLNQLPLKSTPSAIPNVVIFRPQWHTIKSNHIFQKPVHIAIKKIQYYHYHGCLLPKGYFLARTNCSPRLIAERPDLWLSSPLWTILMSFNYEDTITSHRK